MMWNKFDFEDSDLIQFYNENNNIVMKIEYAVGENLDLVNGTLVFIGVSNVIVDSVSRQKVNMHYNCGDVIHLEKQVDSVFILIEWINFETRDDKMVAYEITCDRVKWDWQPTGLKQGDKRPYGD